MFSLGSLFGSLIMMFYSMWTYGNNNDHGGVRHHNQHFPNIGGPMIGTGDAHDKWIVVTASTNSVNDVTALTEIPGWRVVVVGDRNSASLCSNKNCVYLGLDAQNQLGLNLASRLPRDSLARKNVGYLYAIAHGAKVIYETVIENRPQDLLQEFLLKTTTSGLMFNGAHMFNAYRHFGQVTLWPRGYPLNSVGDNDTVNYLLDTWKTPLIQQGLVNRNPEVDAIVHLTRKRKSSSLNITFDSRAPPALVPSGVFSPFNSRNTLFLHDAFWAMFLPVTTPRSVSDIWRGYWAQRLLWEMGGHIGFFPPNSALKNNRHSRSADAEREHDMYFKTGTLVEFLDRWTCRSRETFFGCVTTLSTEMAKQGFWGNSDANLVQHWIHDLMMLGYTEPKRIPFSKKTARIPRNRHLRGRRNKSHLSRVQFVPEVMTPPGVDRSARGHDVMLKQLDKASTICPRLDIKTSMKGVRSTIHDNILLVIAFSNPSNYEVIKVFEALYSLYFPHIVYCGSVIANFYKISPQLKNPVTFVEADVQKGSLRQKCLLKAISMNYRMDGYLFLSADTLLNVWTLSTLPIDHVWYIKPISLNHNHNSGSHSIVHKIQSRNALKAFHKSQHELELANKTMYLGFRKQLWENTNFADDGFLTQVTDVVYIPQRFRKPFLFYADIFTRNGMLHDAAIPTAIGGIVNLKDIHYLDGHYDNHGNGHRFQQYFHKNFNYLYPVNFRKEMKTVDGVRFFCETYLPLTMGR